MDGYSVNEAASVLGVPVERVWELLARGVLSGTPEGETGMRVFLRPRPGPSEAQLDAPAPRGNGATEPERELSPFRELLTEFRNLTERYGQALLALGESRGEVASLRSRVDLLEARMDLGQPAPASSPRPRGWWPGAGPYPTEETVVPARPVPEGAAAPDEAADDLERAEPGGPAESDEHRAKPRGARRATESFAEAIARAQDPSLPDLPEPEITHTAPQAPGEPGIEAPSDADLPHELPAAETVPVADELEGAAEEPVERGAAAAEEEEHALAEELAEAATELEPESVVTEPDAEVVAQQPFEAAEPLEWDTERYTTAIEEPDWFEAEAQADAQPAPMVEAADETPAELQVADEGSTDEPGEAFPGAGDLRSALEALGVGRPAGEPASESLDEPVPPAQAGTSAPAPAPRSEPSGVAAPPVPPSALRYRPVAPAGPTGRAYRRLRRIFPS